MINRLLTFATNRIYSLPVVVLMPHSRCNCRCIMCDIWKANQNKREITEEELARHLAIFRKFGVREIVFSGGEALMHTNLWRLCELLQPMGIRLTLLSTGLLLERYAAEVAHWMDSVIISIDGSAAVHDHIRNVPHGFSKIVSGIQAIRQIKPAFRITGRCVIQRYNYRDYPNIIDAARQIGLDQISFLGADVSTAAFNHPDNLKPERVGEIMLSGTEALDFEVIVRESFVRHAADYESRFIAESPGKMLKIADYYKALNGIGEFAPAVCNAPWVSAVIESNGDVLPCFFHKPYGNLYGRELADIINSPEAIEFRRKLSVKKNDVCKKCVCSLKLGLTQMN